MNNGELVLKNGDSQAFSDSVSPGLTKREYFAAMAMQGYVASSTDSTAEAASRFAVNCADELLKALES